MSLVSTRAAPTSRAWVEVDLEALVRNAAAVRRAVGPAVRLVPMVKADAYGLGMPRVARALAARLAPEELHGFGVATAAEGAALREGGWAGQVIVFSPSPPDDFASAAVHDLVLALSDLDGVRRWAATARALGRALAFHTEIDTGMGRAGFTWDEAGAWGPLVAAEGGNLLRWEGCFTHFHSADEPDLGPTDLQWRRFVQALRALPPEPAGTARRLIHTPNSAASLRRSEYAGDLVRPGIFLYGGEVGAALRPDAVVALRARVALVREVPAGTTLGYGATYQAQRAERWGTLAIGYGDGLPRAVGAAGGTALVRGQRVPIIGRISMDVTVINLTDLPDAVAGEVATLIGRDGEAEIALDEVARLAGTISYEILTGLTPRLPRVTDLPVAPTRAA